MDMITFNTVRLDKITEEANFQAQVLNRQTREDMYRPFSEYETIRHVKKLVFANEETSDEKTTTTVLKYTIVNNVMTEIEYFGQSWIFTELNKQLFGIEHTSKITPYFNRSIAISQVEAVQNLHTISTGHQVISTNNLSYFVCKVINWYLLHMSIQANVKQKILSCITPSVQLLLFKDALLAGTNTRLAASQKIEMT
jgi:tRNA-dihydrouridine synthase